MRQNVYSSAVFTGGRPLCTQILPGQGLPPFTALGIRKLETLLYTKVKTASFCVYSFWHNTGVWRTHRRTDGLAVAYIALAKLALRRAVKTDDKQAHRHTDRQITEYIIVIIIFVDYMRLACVVSVNAVVKILFVPMMSFLCILPERHYVTLRSGLCCRNSVCHLSVCRL